jgi:replicative DNA helicase
MVESVPHGLHAGYHAARVLAGWKRREFGYAMTSAKQSLADPTADVDDVLTATANALECIRDASSPQDDSGTIGDALLTVMSTPEASRIESGLFDLDVLLSGGFAPGQLVTIGARPSVGKTALCSGIALAMARQRVPVLYLSLEMTQREMTTRLMSQSGIDGFDHSDALTELSRLPLFIREAAGWTIERVETIARQYSRRHHVRVVVVDYLSLIRPRDARLPRWEQVSDISRSLKLIALRNDLAVIAAQQLGRAIEDRPDHRPRMSDFRESGSIEQDSDILAAIERPTRPDEGDMTAARLHVLKHRNGSTGIIDLRFDPARTLFADAGFTA